MHWSTLSPVFGRLWAPRRRGHAAPHAHLRELDAATWGHGYQPQLDSDFAHIPTNHSAPSAPEQLGRSRDLHRPEDDDEAVQM